MTIQLVKDEGLTKELMEIAWRLEKAFFELRRRGLAETEADAYYTVMRSLKAHHRSGVWDAKPAA